MIYNFKSILKSYWIFLVTIICYCIGFIIHFISQYCGYHPNYGKKDLINVKPELYSINSTTDNNTTLINNDKYAKPDNLFYFMQISDIHMSKKYTKGTQGNFIFLLQKMIPIIEPNFLFITGDMTDSMSNGLTNIETIEDDWIMYRKIIESTGIDKKNNGTFLWDIRGNHDCFKVPEWNSKYNYFKDYSHTKTRGFTFNYEVANSTYSFVGLDGCPIVTTTNPFFGIIDEVSMDMYSDFMDKAKSNPNNKHNFVFIHYPETTLVFGKSSTGKKWNDYTKDISLLLTGHFHTLGGFHTYAYHDDYLEMELIDFKMHGTYRIVSVDNDIVSISDRDIPLPNFNYDFKTSNIDDLLKHPPEIFNMTIPPVVHITLPKDSRFVIKSGEPIKESFSSEYIRVLVFSQQSPSNLKFSLFIDNELQHNNFTYVGDQKLNKRSSKSNIKINIRDEKNKIVNENNHTIDFKTPPLWIAKWNNSIYNDGKSHELKIVVIDNTNQLSGEDIIKFRLDGKQDKIDISSKGAFILKTSFPITLPIAFGFVYIIYEIMVLLPRLYSIIYIKPKHSNLPFFPNRYISDIISEETKSFQTGFFKKHFILPFIEAFTYNGIFYPIQISLICLLVLPGKVGLITRSSEKVSKLGGEFLYGLYSSGQWSSVTDLYGIYLFFFILVTFIDTLLITFLNHKRKGNIYVNIAITLLLTFICIIQVLGCIAISYVCGGIMSVFFSPFPTWQCIYLWVLIYMIMIRRMKKQDDIKKNNSLSQEEAQEGTKNEMQV
ncbi:hypothetical protein BCR32DRAFT_298247 [Anaeromyces robustus]|uniref:Uncharacterized protein n=1 Tax=Anaeromyces robustus TaxID=1754192 RepID=A0A1Y1VRR6_9FUNG|nr:hypothetical protein BCR32DRAFT_298247 [Anaeromyces robustus]|eukprot:ORX63992.1 hypothetical protein BCR32DRAFT_298247 [Anaeromyces robustus]